jgi:hypothetical protein
MYIVQVHEHVQDVVHMHMHDHGQGHGDGHQHEHKNLSLITLERHYVFKKPWNLAKKISPYRNFL